MRQFDYDLFVIGAGSGGVRGSRISAGYGARTAICESFRVGGTCVIRGCVPKKLLSYAAHFSEDFEDAAGYGWQVDGWRFSWEELITRKDREIDRLNEVYCKILGHAGVELMMGRGVLEDAHTINLDGKQITADKILLATGGWPYKPKIPGAELAITSNEVFDLPEFPQRVAVYGGGYIALEFAGIFNGLGADTTLVYRRGEVLRGFDHDIRTLMREELGHKGVKRRLETEITALEKTAGGIRVSYNNGEPEEVDQVLFATGRVPNVEGLGLESVGVETREGAVVVDEYSQTSVENIYAVGDVTDRMALTPVALMEGEAFARTVFGDEATPVDHAWVPSAVFSNPPIGTVGLTEEEARSQFGELDIYRSVFRPMKHTLSGREEKSMMKLVVDRKSQRVVGVHLVGLDAPEMLQGFGVAVKMGATKAQFDQTIGIHPTSAEELVTMRNPIDA